jgi:hypothetical protein
MGRLRSGFVVLVLLALVCVPVGVHAAPKRSRDQCGLGSQATVNGSDGTNRIATYVVTATWCATRVRSGDTKRSGDGGGRGGARRSRAPVATCMSNFDMKVTTTVANSGVVFKGASTKPLDGDACGGRAFRITGTFVEEYVNPMSAIPRSVVKVPVSGVTIENYPLGKVGDFDITVRFATAGDAGCENCERDFPFCDVRLSSSDAASCIHLG